ncbi:hypothetical protein B2G71_20505 [Novosphingobium sp. PC22D]|nr:hypothetical protein B2G71_20505 [Novosphingobium sp. PC22D]
MTSLISLLFAAAAAIALTLTRQSLCRAGPEIRSLWRHVAVPDERMRVTMRFHAIGKRHALSAPPALPRRKSRRRTSGTAKLPAHRLHHFAKPCKTA